MTFFEPTRLILLIPAIAALYWWRMPTRLLAVLRAILIVLLVILVADPAIKLDDRRGTVVVIADRSDSMPEQSQSLTTEAIELMQDSMPPGNSLAVVSFARKAQIEKSAQAPLFDQFLANHVPDASNLSEALDQSMAIIGRDKPGRIVIFSDGLWTGSQPFSQAASLASREIAIDYRLIARKPGRDLAIASIDAPQKVTPGQIFMVNVWLHSPESTEITYELVRGNRIIGRGTRNISAGLNHLTFHDRAGDIGSYNYEFKVSGFEDDNIQDNNTARFLTQIDTTQPLLVLTNAADSGLVKLLRADGINVVQNTPLNQSYALEDLTTYAAVLLEDVSANDIGKKGMQNLAAWVEQLGKGLIMTGGPNSYGPGGYYRSPLEPIFPVSMELRREHRNLNMAIAIVLDRSGSMAAQATPTLSKMDLANAASGEVLGLMSENDEIAVIAVDSSPHRIANLQAVGSPSNRDALYSKIMSIESMGGGIFVYTGLLDAANVIAQSNAETRHIILFADAADSEEPGDYIKLLESLQAAGVTVSVIGLGNDTDRDADFLRDVAARGNGRIFFTQDPLELPRLFAQDTFMVARNSFIEEPTPFEFTPAVSTIADIPETPTLSIGGYNLCYTRPDATLSAVTTDGYDAPVLATWQYGTGRVAAFCAQADGNYAGQLASWQYTPQLYSSLARWAIGDSQQFSNDMVVTQKIQNGIARIQIHFDSSAPELPFTDPLLVTTLTDQAGLEPIRQTYATKLVEADKLAVDIPLSGDKTVIATVDAGPAGQIVLPPVCLPYSPEHKTANTDDGRDTLRRLASMTGGGQISDLTGIWETVPIQPAYVDMTTPLAIAAIIILLLEILERRTGVLSLLSVLAGKRRKKEPATEAAAQDSATSSSKATATPAKAPVPPAQPITQYMKKITRRKKKSNSPQTKSAAQSPAANEQQSQQEQTTQPEPDDQKEDMLDALKKLKRKR